MTTTLDRPTPGLAGDDMHLRLSKQIRILDFSHNWSLNEVVVWRPRGGGDVLHSRNWRGPQTDCNSCGTSSERVRRAQVFSGGPRPPGVHGGLWDSHQSASSGPHAKPYRG